MGWRMRKEKLGWKSTTQKGVEGEKCRMKGEKEGRGAKK